MVDNQYASAGHKLGQIIGDWFEEYVALPVLQQVAYSLRLYPDSRFNKRSMRGSKGLIWSDLEGNTVDYDVIFELGGSDQDRGDVIAAFETFWRRGSRHSKDKVRDDSGKLMMIRETYVTARMFFIYAAGDFAMLAKELVKSRGIDLFHIPKEEIVDAWNKHNITIDYPDKSGNEFNKNLADTCIAKINKDPDLKKKIADSLWAPLGEGEQEMLKAALKSKLCALPCSYLIDVVDFCHIEFDSRDIVQNKSRMYNYRVDYRNGDTFERQNLNWDELKRLHGQVGHLVTHVEALLKN